MNAVIAAAAVVFALDASFFFLIRHCLSSKSLKIVSAASPPLPPHHLIGLQQLEIVHLFLLLSFFSCCTFNYILRILLEKCYQNQSLTSHTAYHTGQWVYCVKNWPLTTLVTVNGFFLLLLLLLPPSLTDSGSSLLIPTFLRWSWLSRLCAYTNSVPSCIAPQFHNSIQFDHTFALVCMCIVLVG